MQMASSEYEEKLRSDFARVKRHQEMYKALTKTPPWKETFREKCFQRLKQSRGKLVDRFRRLDNDQVFTDFLENKWDRIFKDDESDMDENEVNHLINIMEDIKNELEEEEGKRFEDTFGTEFEATVEWFERDDMICPICQKHPLQQHLSVIFCVCGLRIDVQQDGLTLDHLKQQFREGNSLHDRSCKMPPNFDLLSVQDITNLIITCKFCDFMYIVI